jgi:hypothetical protein
MYIIQYVLKYKCYCIHNVYNILNVYIHFVHSTQNVYINKMYITDPEIYILYTIYIMYMYTFCVLYTKCIHTQCVFFTKCVQAVNKDNNNIFFEYIFFSTLIKKDNKFYFLDVLAFLGFTGKYPQSRISSLCLVKQSP